MFKQMAPMAMRRIMVKLIVDSIATQEGMEVTEEKRDEYLQKYATEASKDIEEVRKGFEGADITFLVKTFMVDELLCETTTILPAHELNIIKIGDPEKGIKSTDEMIAEKQKELEAVTASE
jgi:FKBP-type peptidyl-prolyl cis-trans isomerase (trigger factor)